VEDHPAPEAELPGVVIEELPGLGELRDDALVGVPADEGIEDARADRGKDRGQVHGRIEVLGRPRNGDPELTLGLRSGRRAGQNRESSQGGGDPELHGPV